MKSGGGGGPRVQPLSYPPADTELELGEAGKGSEELLPNLFFGGRPPSPAGSGVGPLPGREGDITHQSSHPPALHLLVLLPLPRRRPPPRSR